MKKIDTITAFHANEDGTTCQKAVAVYYTGSPACSFVIQLPKWIAEHAHIKSEAGPSPTHVLALYEQRCDAYSRWKLSFKAEPKLAIKVVGHPSFNGNVRLVGMGMEEVGVTTSGDVYARDADGTLTRKLDSIDWTYLLDDTPAVRQKAQELMESLSRASSLLNGMSATSDPQAYFLALSPSTTTPEKPVAEPQQAELPLEPPAPSPAPAAPVADEDDDL